MISNSFSLISGGIYSTPWHSAFWLAGHSHRKSHDFPTCVWLATEQYLNTLLLVHSVIAVVMANCCSSWHVTVSCNCILRLNLDAGEQVLLNSNRIVESPPHCKKKKENKEQHHVVVWSSLNNIRIFYSDQPDYHSIWGCYDPKKFWSLKMIVDWNWREITENQLKPNKTLVFHMTVNIEFWTKIFSTEKGMLTLIYPRGRP